MMMTTIKNCVVLLALLEILTLPAMSIASNETERIIGGDEADPGEYPWFVRGVKHNEEPIHCGGALITPEYVLTAGHCRMNYPDKPDYKKDPNHSIETVTFEIGAYCNKNKWPWGCYGKPEPIRRKAKHVYDHDDFNEKIKFPFDYDFELIHLDEPVRDVDPVPIDTESISSDYNGGEVLTAIGEYILYNIIVDLFLIINIF